MKIRVLGCGGSFGSPLAWGRNGNIDVNNPHNFRTRSSVLISNNNQNILIDTSPDLRDQLYKAKCTKIDAVLFTHEHSDHTAGLPDMRAMSLINKSIIPEIEPPLREVPGDSLNHVNKTALSFSRCNFIFSKPFSLFNSKKGDTKGKFSLFIIFLFTFFLFFVFDLDLFVDFLVLSAFFVFSSITFSNNS